MPAIDVHSANPRHRQNPNPGYRQPCMRSESSHQRSGEVGSQRRPTPYKATTQCACFLKNDGSEALLLWNMIHSLYSFLATGCQSAGVIQGFTFSVMKELGAAGQWGWHLGDTSPHEVGQSMVCFEDEETKPAEGRTFCLSSYWLFEAGICPAAAAAAAGFLPLN